MRTNTVTLTGNVVVTQGQDVLRGQRLVVDLTSGVSRMESGGGRVEGLFQSNRRNEPSARPGSAIRRALPGAAAADELIGDAAVVPSR